MKFLPNLIIKAGLIASTALFHSAAYGDDIKVGSVAGLSGPTADLVVPIVAARNLAAKHVNDQGGLLSGDRYKLVEVDSSCDPFRAVEMGKKIVDKDHVIGVIGANCSGATSALAVSVTIPGGIVQISDSAAAPGISILDDRGLVFRVAPSDAFQGVALAKLMIGDGVEKAAVIYAKDDYNVGLANVFISEFEKEGGTVVASHSHGTQKQSYEKALKDLVKNDVKTLVIFSYFDSGGTTILKESFAANLFENFYASDGMLDRSLIQQIGQEKLQGHIKITQGAADIENESYKLFAKLFKETGLDPTSPYAAHGYDASFLMALAIEKAATTERARIATALTKIDDGSQGSTVIRPGEWAKAKKMIKAGKPINYEGASGSVDFDENGDVTGAYSVNIVDDKGNWSGKLLDF